MSARPRLFAIAVVLLMLFAGCLKKPDDKPVTNTTPTTNVTTANTTLPNGQTFVSKTETNKTETGVGGVDHKHDYWKGKDRIDIMSRDIFFSCPPCEPDGQGTQAKDVTYVKLDKLPDGTGDALVYEGTEKVEILFTAPQIVVADGAPPVAHPSPPTLFLQFRSASDAKWRDPVQVTYGTPTVVPVTPEMTDMPHSTHSLWVFRLTTDRPDQGIAIPMKVTIVKGREVVNWPGHPDFYADKHERVVMSQHVTTHMPGADGAILYDSEGTWVHPERLISWGTKEIHVFINITSAKNAYGASATGFFLEAMNASYIGPEVSFGSRHGDINGKDDLKSYEYALFVNDTGMDGPYQPESRWSFRELATYATLPDNPVANGLCPGCFPYDIEYDITVLAMDHTDDKGQWLQPPV